MQKTRFFRTKQLFNDKNIYLQLDIITQLLAEYNLDV